jgi:hypothetical protein
VRSRQARDDLAKLGKPGDVDRSLDGLVPGSDKTAYRSIAAMGDESGKDHRGVVEVNIAIDPPLVLEDVDFGGG